MRRAIVLVSTWSSFVAAGLQAGCAGTTAEAPTRAFHRQEEPAAPADPAPRENTRSSAAPADATAAPAVAAPSLSALVSASTPPPETEDVTEVDLRQSLAKSPDPTDAALELASWLVAQERCPDALSVLDAALVRHRTPLLRIARAGVLRDLGQRHLARFELQALRLEQGAMALHPSLLFELAELEWLEGDPGGAASTLRELASVHASDPWTAAHRGELQTLARDAERGGRPKVMRARDLLGNLRGAPLATERLAVLDQLGTAPAGEGAARRQLREHAIAIALGDEAAPVRSRAVQLACPDAAVAEEFCREALADPAPLVRQAAAVRAAGLLGAGARPLLLECLGREQDVAAFLAEHEALAAATGVPDVVTTAAVSSPAGRAEVVARWRARSVP